MMEDKALKKAARDSIRSNNHTLSSALQSSPTTFQKIVEKCAAQKIIPGETNAYLDTFTGQSLAYRAGQLVGSLQSTVGVVPRTLDDILCILHESDSLVVQEAAKKIAKDYKELNMAAVTKIFGSSAHDYMMIGTGLNVNVSDLIQLPGTANTTLIIVFQRWFNANRDVNWDTLMKLCDDFPDQLGKAKSNLQEYIGQFSLPKYEGLTSYQQKPSPPAVTYTETRPSRKVSQSTLTIRNLKEVLNDLRDGDFNDKSWYSLGVELGLRSRTLNNIKSNNSEAEECLRACISKWLGRADDVDANGGANWITLCNAIERINETGAAYIRDRHMLSQPAKQINYQDHSEPSQITSALRKWMKKGSVDLTVTRVNMLGIPGSGKTCAQLMLLDEDPPTEEVNDSTEIACPTVRAVRVAADDESMKWKRITKDKLLEGLAVDLTEALLEKKEALSSGTQAVSPEDTDQSSVSSVFDDSVSSKQIENDVDFHADEVIQEILAKDLTDIRLKGHWLYVIDSGGQPAYQELLPLFTRAAFLNIITLDLSKPFDEEFDLKYRIDGSYFSCRSKSTQLASFQSTVSTAANFKSLDISCVTKPHRHSMHLVLGTHYDKVDEATLKACEDALSSSISSLQPYLNDRIIKKSKNSIIFPVDTVAESKEERAKYRKKVCQAIWKDGSDASVTIQIPVRWFAFELLLPEKRSIISFEEAVSIGRTCGMKKEDTMEALQYFHDVSVMLYYPKVIHHVVFLDPKPILKILSHLLALTYDVDDENTHDDIKTLDDSELRKFISPLQLSKTDIENLKDGFFHEEIFTFLKSKSEIFSHSEFQIPDLISLLLHLNIITKVEGNEKGSYFIPYALPSYRSDSRPTVEESKVRSLLIVWREKKKYLPVPQGLFPLALMHLLNQKELKIELPSSSRSDFYFKFRDAMSIQITFEEIPRTLHLINRYTHIEIAFTGPQEHCSKIHKVVMKAIEKVTDDLHMEHNYTCPNDLKECYCLVNKINL